MIRPLPLIGLTTDSLTADLFGKRVQLNGLTQSYIMAVRAAGGVPVLLPQGVSEDELQSLVDNLDGLILPGGEDVDPGEYEEKILPTCGIVDRGRDQLELPLARGAIGSGLPLLGICRGHRVLNVVQGGTLWQDIATQVPHALEHSCSKLEEAGVTAHTVKISRGSMLAQVLGTEQVDTNSSHHQAIRRLGAGLVATAWAPDGLVEAVELQGHPFAVAVQWHPERMYREHPCMLRLFYALVEAARVNRHHMAHV